jgi:hypothetical protein
MWNGQLAWGFQSPCHVLFGHVIYKELSSVPLICAVPSSVKLCDNHKANQIQKNMPLAQFNNRNRYLSEQRQKVLFGFF